MKEYRPEPMLRIKGLSKTFAQGRWWEKKFVVRALDGIDLSAGRGKTLAIVGRSGSGKTTLALCLAMLEKPSSGHIWFEGRSVFLLAESERAQLRPDVQLVFQDSAAALPSRFSAAEILAEPLIIQNRYSRRERLEVVSDLLAKVGLPREWGNRFPHQFSGGQRQRLAIARALALRPKLLILDEPFVGLDLSVRGQIINLLLQLQADLALTYICISHDFELVGYFADRVAVLEQGRLVEEGDATDFRHDPANTQANIQSFRRLVPSH
jgi:ABC-type glutathione transport system ATPase component